MPNEYLYEEHKEVNLDYPDSAIRLACVVHKFKMPKMAQKINFAYSFRTASSASQDTKRLLRQADDARDRLDEALALKKTSADRVLQDSDAYLPLIHQILLSAKVQPEAARLDERLLFEWKSGIESSPRPFKNEAIMYDLTMTLVCQGLGHSAKATEHAVQGDFANATKEYAAAAGVWDYLADTHLVKWIAKTDSKSTSLPSECHAPCAQALNLLFLANGQQMAIATLLMKDKVNYALVGKLCYGVYEQLTDFLTLFRKEASTQKDRVDPEFWTLVAFQIVMQQGLSLYFQARALWDKADYGVAIAMLSEATVLLRTRETPASNGLPDVTLSKGLKSLTDDVKDLRQHMALVLHHWEKDNNSIYFTSVPKQVPTASKLQQGHKMNKMTNFVMPEVEPVLFSIPEGNLQRSDSDLARELSEKLNAGYEV